VPSRVLQFDLKQLKMAVPSKLGHITQEIIGMKIRVFFCTYLDIAGDNYNTGKSEAKRLLCRHRRR
jgi:hypothetical protein